MSSPPVSLAVLVPVYNEQHLVAASLRRLADIESSPHLARVQVVVVDDSSRDRTPEVLEAFAAERGVTLMPPSPPAPRAGTGAVPAAERGRVRHGKTEWIFLRHERNGGKGNAIQTALAYADADITVIHDADLEYHPIDILRLVRVFIEEDADAVFGSRFAGAESRRVLFFRHELGNRLLTFLTNLVTNLNLTDMETCYKAVRTDLLRSIPITSNDFRLEPELTIKLAKREARVFEVPIRYSGRTYQEGKKIGWRDGVLALGAILKFAFSENLYRNDDPGRAMTRRLAAANRFTAWLADLVRPHLGTRLLEIGSGTGAITKRLVPRDLYVASDVDPLHVATLRNLTGDRPYLEVSKTDVTDLASFPVVERGFDTVVALNVIEHVEDDVGAMRNIRSVLAPGGCAVVLVPSGPWNFGSLDEALGHKRRYTEETIRELAARSGFEVAQVLRFNRISSLPWWVNGRLLRRRAAGRIQIGIVDWLTPLLRRIDPFLGLPPLSIIAVLRVPSRGEARMP